MKKDERGKVIEGLLRKAIPRNVQGDPQFIWLYNEEFDKTYTGPFTKGLSLLEVFSAEEIVALCNRQLYQLEYQRSWHRQWERRKAQNLEPLKRKVVEMFPDLRSWTKASDEQLRLAQAELNKLKG